MILQHIREDAATGFLSEEIAKQNNELVSFALQEVENASITMIRKKSAKTFPAIETFIRYLQSLNKKEIKPLRLTSNKYEKQKTLYIQAFT